MKNCNMKIELPQEVLREIVRGVMSRDSPAAVDFVVEALVTGRSFDDLERQKNIDGELAPCCRNTFYRWRRLAIAQILEKDGAQYGEK